MKRILYIHPKCNAGRTDQVLRNCGHVLIVVSKYVDALEMLRSQSFDALVIEEEDENSLVLDFTVRAHSLRPELPVFLTIDWDVELPMALESLGAVGQFSEETPGELSVLNGLPASRRL